MLVANKSGSFPHAQYRLLRGLRVHLDLLQAEAWSVYLRHARAGEGQRAAAYATGFEVQCRVEKECSPVLTGVVMPMAIRPTSCAPTFSRTATCSLGAGLGKVADEYSASATSAISTT